MQAGERRGSGPASSATRRSCAFRRFCTLHLRDGKAEYVDHRVSFRTSARPAALLTPCVEATGRSISGSLARRLDGLEACELQSVHRWGSFAEDLDAIDELVRLVAQRTACPELDSDIGGELERRLGELDGVDAALHLRSAYGQLIGGAPVGVDHAEQLRGA